MREYEVGDLVRYYSETAHQEYIGIISEPDVITWFCDGEKEDVDNYADFPLDRDWETSKFLFETYVG